MIKGQITNLRANPELDKIAKDFWVISELLKADKHAINIGFDTEFQSISINDTETSAGEVYLFQLALYDNNGKVQRVVIDNKFRNYNRITFKEFEEEILIPTIQIYRPDIEPEEYGKLNINIYAHYSVAEQSTISDLYEIAKTETNLQTTRYGKLINFRLRNNTVFKSLKFMDTLNFEKSSLEKIGESIGFEKVNLQQELEDIYPKLDYKGIENFRRILEDEKFRETTINYASIDPVICLLLSYGMSKLHYEQTGILRVFETTPQATENLFLDRIEMQKVHSTTEWTDECSFWESLGRTEIKVPVKTPSGKVRMKVVRRLHNEIRSAGEASYHGGRNQVYTVGQIKIPALDFDYKSAYPIFLCLIKALKLKRTKIENQDQNLSFYDTIQSKLYTLEAFEAYLNTLSPYDQITLQGTFSGTIVYKDDVLITPTIDNVSNGLAELLVSNSTHHILALTTILKHKEIIDWKQTTIQEIRIFETEDDLVFKEYVTFLVTERKKYPKGTFYNLLFKLYANSLYGKLAQGIDVRYTNNFLLDAKTRKPESLIFNPLFASFVTTGLHCLTFEAGLKIFSYAKDHPSEPLYLLNVITDGFLLASTNLDIFDSLNLDDEFLSKTILATKPGETTLLELKHRNLGGTYLTRPRIDFPLEYIPNPDGLPMKIAKPSVYDFKKANEDSIKIIIQELNQLRNAPSTILSANRLASAKAIYSSHTILYRYTVRQTINWNIVGNKYISEVLDNEFVTGCRLGLFTTKDQVEQNLEFIRKRVNYFMPNDVEAMVRLQQYQLNLLHGVSSGYLKITDKDSFTKQILNDVVYFAKRLNISLKYPLLKPELKTMFSQTQFRDFKKNCRARKFNFVSEKLFNYFQKVINLLNLDRNDRIAIYKEVYPKYRSTGK